MNFLFLIILIKENIIFIISYIIYLKKLKSYIKFIINNKNLKNEYILISGATGTSTRKIKEI